METWELLSEVEYDVVWDKFYEQFNFKPSVDRQDFPSIKEPSPSITFEFDFPVSSEVLDDFDDKTLGAFVSVVENGNTLYALDWHHDCYRFRPYLPFVEWRIPVFPNGDYYIFLAEDFSFGLFGHPWEQTICVWGKNLLSEFEKNKPLLFDRIVRQK